MRKSIPILLPVTATLIISLACGLLPSIPAVVPTMDANALGTAIVQTMVAAATQTAGAVVPVAIVDSPTATQTLTFTPEPPTLSPTATLSLTPPLTSTPSIPLISVSKDTNCRVGPGSAYDRNGALMVGETAEVVASDPTGRYWYIKNPDQANGYCWLWTEYATLSGNTSALPVFTPPPTPTLAPSFEAAYESLEDCAAWWMNFQLTNTGGITFKSISLTVSDLKAERDISRYADKFTSLDGCHGSSTKDELGPGERFTVSSSAFAENPDGHKMRATITLCSAAGQSGMCVTQVLKFTP